MTRPPLQPVRWLNLLAVMLGMLAVMKRKEAAKLSDRAGKYVRDYMALFTDDQEGNWIWGHMAWFVAAEIDRDRRSRRTPRKAKARR